ncbi:hypothetical protein J2Z76_002612 [Sedimentibacter acidaminivorans]|jgi:hypothetical protein|uniref:Uncharacterized protein n=1 Tax=Sedimentibacter acidaminivorans TaxID=913099 RepID=A0ABS4GGT3_9FIRM|nr:hypothetical protein [Sedimentibacter acidaminivorans]MBP1926742.1 hypothetical protein [Sedimentibacter acidaminivorans]
MKKFISYILIGIMILGCMNIGFALENDNVISNKVSNENGNLVIVKGNEMNNLFKLDEVENLKSSTSTIENNMSFSIDGEKNNQVNILMDGMFDFNGILCEVEAEGTADIYSTKKLGQLYLGNLKGKIKINGEERNIRVSYERNYNNIYYAISINDLGCKEGYSVFTFGDSLLDKEVLAEIVALEKESKELNALNNIKSYDPTDSDWEELDDYPNGNLVLRARLFAEDDIVDYSDDGKLMVITQVDKDDVENELEDNNDYTVLLITIDEFDVDFQSIDEESYFTSQNPSETDSSNSIFSFILDVFGDLGVPSSLLSAIELVGENIGDDVTITYDNDSYRRHLNIEPENDTYMDWSEYPDGGYPVTIGVEKDNNATDDDIDIDVEASLGVFLNQSNIHFVIDTGEADLDIDLADY